MRVSDERWLRVIRGFERGIIQALIVLLMGIVTITTFELGWLLVKGLLQARGPMLLDVADMFEVFGFFLLVMIGVELLTTLKGYLRAGVIHVEVVLEVALIAVAQKVIVLDSARTGPLGLIGLAVLILALAGSFFVVRVARERWPLEGRKQLRRQKLESAGERHTKLEADRDRRAGLVLGPEDHGDAHERA